MNFETSPCNKLLGIRLALEEVLARDARGLVPVPTDCGELNEVACSINVLIEELESQRHRNDAQQAEMNRIFETVGDGVAVLTPDGVITRVNGPLASLLKSKEAVLTGRSINDLMAGDGEGDQAVERLMGLGELNDHAVDLVTVTGDLIPAAVTGSVMRDRTGEIYKLVLVLRDVRQRNRLQETISELQTTQNQLYRAQKMEAIGRLAGGIAHDFNNYLTVILGFAGLMKEALPPGSGQLEDLDEILAASEGAKSLTDQLMAFSRTQILKPESVDLAELVNKTRRMVEGGVGPQIELLCFSHGGLWPVHIDPPRFQQLILNLAINARDAMPNGGTLSIHTANVTLEQAQHDTESGLAAGDYVMLVVSDTGGGMPAHVRDRIFEPFFTTKGRGKGTGLGLATCYGTVRQAGGTIRVDSQLGLGTTFVIYLPRDTEDREQTTKRSDSRVRMRKREIILVVDDDPPVRELVVRALKRQGHQVLDAGSAMHALEMVDEHENIAMLVTDVLMPQMNGRELADAVLGRYPAMKVLFMSGYTADMLDTQTESTHFLHKPFSPNQLAKKVREVLEAA